MACYDREILSRYQDGSLSEVEGRRIAGHLDECATCRETFAALAGEQDRKVWLLERGCPVSMVDPAAALGTR